jgi:Tol biopolymer transport system component
MLAAPSTADALLAYRSHSGMITVARNDGSSPHALTRGQLPSVSPDGRHVTFFTGFSSESDAGTLHVMDRRGRHLRVLARDVYSPGFRMQPLPWSPSSDLVAASSNGRSFGGYVFDLEARKRLFIASDFRFDGATFSPTSPDLIYEDSSTQCDDGGLVLFHIETRKRRKLGCGETVVWGRRGFAFVRGSGVYFASRPGRRARRLVSDGDGVVLPRAWSADGTRLLLYSYTADTPGVRPMFVNLQAGTVQRLDVPFAWITTLSRDGRHVLGRRHGNVIAARDDGRVTVLARNASQPSWNR